MKLINSWGPFIVIVSFLSFASFSASPAFGPAGIGKTIVLTCDNVPGYTLNVGICPYYNLQYITPNGATVDIILSLTPSAPAELNLSQLPIVWQKVALKPGIGRGEIIRPVLHYKDGIR